MWINTQRTETMRQKLEHDFPFMNLAVEQQFPSHPTQGTRYRVYRTDSDRAEFYTYNPADMRDAILRGAV
jgi:hypothetical protein